MTPHICRALALHEDGSEELLGEVRLTDGVLSIVSLADEDDTAYLQQIVAAANALDVIVEKAPPSSTDARYAIGVARTERGAPGFEEALLRKLAKSHATKLVPHATS